MNTHPLNIRPPDIHSSMQIWEGDTCVGLRCENAQVWLDSRYIVSGTIMVGEVYLIGVNSTASCKVVVRRIIDNEIVEIKEINNNNRSSRCSAPFLLCLHICRRVSNA